MTAHSIHTAPRVVDGMPHLAYFDPGTQLSFVWSGRLAEPIHVQHGGYGEPTVALIDPAKTYAAGEHTPAELFDWFRDTCDTWTAQCERLFGVVR